ncbi:MAG TPA: PadR family transcriptional regulator [Dehalococcoidia bacterium]|nr:PadR family transcriptional regulator [Dehalococcoidia bacterium]
MSLKHALLGFLNYGPHTGYEIKKVFDISVAHFWSAELSQIYPSLKTLEAEGLVEMKVEVQADRPNRKVYSITDDGRRELIDWLGNPADPEQVREPLLVKLFFAAAGNKEHTLTVLKRRVDDLRLRLEGYRQGLALVERYSSAARLESEALFWRLTIEYEITHTEANLKFINDTIEMLDTMDDRAFIAAPDQYAGMATRDRVEILDALKKAIMTVKEMDSGVASARAPLP